MQSLSIRILPDLHELAACSRNHEKSAGSPRQLMTFPKRASRFMQQQPGRGLGSPSERGEAASAAAVEADVEQGTPVVGAVPVFSQVGALAPQLLEFGGPVLTASVSVPPTRRCSRHRRRGVVKMSCAWSSATLRWPRMPRARARPPAGRRAAATSVAPWCARRLRTFARLAS